MDSIKYVENGDYFSEGWGVISCFHEISQEEYDRLGKLSHAELNDLMESSLDETIKCGYGYYGCGLRKRDNGKCYVYYKRGSTCD